MVYQNRTRDFFNENPQITMEMVKLQLDEKLKLTVLQEYVIDKRFEGLTFREIAKRLNGTVATQSLAEREVLALKKLEGYKNHFEILLD